MGHQVKNCPSENICFWLAAEFGGLECGDFRLF